LLPLLLPLVLTGCAWGGTTALGVILGQSNSRKRGNAAPELVDPLADAPQRVLRPPFESPGGVAAGDLDGDGDTDLVAADDGADAILVVGQSAPGSMSVEPALSDPAVVDPVDTVVADLDGDGDLDVASANAGGAGNLAIFFQTAPATFGAPLILDDPSLGIPFRLGVGDLDGDGDLDLVTVTVSPNELAVFLQGPPGTFAFGPVLPGPSTARGVAVGDMDQDGDLDLVGLFGTGTTGEARVFLQDNAVPGTFPSFLVLAEPDALPLTLALGDLNGDTALDVVYGRDDETLGIWHQSAGTFPAVTVISSGFVLGEGAAGDLDGDGRDDLVWLLFGPQLRTQHVPGVLSAAALTGVALPVSAVLVDLDGDGELDMAGARFLGDSLDILFNR
jgi:hypothetical protein